MVTDEVVQGERSIDRGLWQRSSLETGERVFTIIFSVIVEFIYCNSEVIIWYFSRFFTVFTNFHKELSVIFRSNDPNVCIYLSDLLYYYELSIIFQDFLLVLKI